MDIQVKNHYSFTNLSQYEIDWTVSENENVIQSGKFVPLDVEPGHSTEINIPFKKPKLNAGCEYWLNINVRLKKDVWWANKGYSIAKEQFKLPYAVAPKPDFSLTEIPELKFNSSDKDITISNSSFSIVIDKTNGDITAYKYNNSELLKSPIKPNYWRVPTDNDNAGWQHELDAWNGAGKKEVVEEVKVTSSNDKMVVIEVKGKIPIGETTFKTMYTIFGNGTLKLSHTITPIGNVPIYIPKIGMQFSIPKEYSTMTWYGRGPQENYWDRKTAAEVGQYSGLIDTLWTDYVRPQENGNRSDVRWAIFTNNNGKGFFVLGNTLLNISAWPHSQEDLENADHINELPLRDFYTINLDYLQMGVGGADTWTRDAIPLMQYRIRSECSYSYGFTLIPYSPEMGSMQKIINVNY